MNNQEAEMVIGLYRKGLTSPDRMAATTVGREMMVNDLLEKLQINSGKTGGEHYLFVGPRGIGKTHYLTLVENSINESEGLKKSYLVIRFPEENNRILSFADFLLGVVEILGQETSDPNWQDLYTSTCEINDDHVIRDTIIPRLKDFYKKTKIRLLVMLENLDVVLNQQIRKSEDIHSLRSFLMDSPSITLVATSPIYFSGLLDIKAPLYDFFDIQVIEELSEQETITLIKKNLEWDGRQDLIDSFSSLKQKIQSMHTMTGGNCRLVMMLYQLIGRDNIRAVRIQFQKLLDQISPFYQDRLKDMGPQERALVETIALLRTVPRTPLNISKNLRMTQQQTSALLKRLVKSGYLTVSNNPVDQRSKLYKIKEGFFDIWLAMSQSRAQKNYMVYLVDFLDHWYANKEERERKREELRELLSETESMDSENKNQQELLGYMTELGDKKEKIATKLELMNISIKDGCHEKAKEYIREVDALKPEGPGFQWMKDKAGEWLDVGEVEKDIFSIFEEMILCWKHQRTGDFEKAVVIANNLGVKLTGKGLHKILIELLKESANALPEGERKIETFLRTSNSLTMAGDFRESEKYLILALDIAGKQKTSFHKSAILNNLGLLSLKKGDLDNAFRRSNQSLKIQKEIGDKRGEGITLNNISQIYHDRGDLHTALKYLKQSLGIQKEIGDKRGEGGALNNISQIYHARGNFDTALKYLNQSLKIRQEIGDKSGEGITLNNISQLYQARGNFDTALKYLKQSLKIQKEIGDFGGLCSTIFNIGHIHHAKKEIPQALSSWVRAYKIVTQIPLANVLKALENLAQQLDLPGEGLEAWALLEKKLKK